MQGVIYHSLQAPSLCKGIFELCIKSIIRKVVVVIVVAPKDVCGSGGLCPLAATLLRHDVCHFLVEFVVDLQATESRAALLHGLLVSSRQPHRLEADDARHCVCKAGGLLAVGHLDDVVSKE